METEAPAHHILRIDERGRITLPADLRKEFGIGRGAWVELQRASGNSLNIQLLSNRDSRINELMRGDFQSRSEDAPLTQELFALFDEVIAEVRAERSRKSRT